jgi:hypothetical protein
MPHVSPTSARVQYRGRDYTRAQPCPSRRLRAAAWPHEHRRYKRAETLRAWAYVSGIMLAGVLCVALAVTAFTGLLDPSPRAGAERVVGL